MNIQFSIFGLAIVVVFYLFTAGVLVIIGLQIKDRRWRKILIVPVALIAVALPWIDEVLTAWNFKQICRTAGAQIDCKVEVEGFLNAASPGRSSSSLARPGLITDRGGIVDFDRLGYRYTEALFGDGKVWHLERVQHGIQASILDRPQARYHFLQPLSDSDAGRAASCSEDTILDAEKQEIIAKYRYCKRYASLPERIWLGLVHRGPVEYCPGRDKELKGSLFHAVLIPARKP